jgi:hypothetical protein
VSADFNWCQALVKGVGKIMPAVWLIRNCEILNSHAILLLLRAV